MSTLEPAQGRTIGLHALRAVPLEPDAAERLRAAASAMRGDAPWKCRMLSEAHDLLALAQIAPTRVAVADLSLGDDLRAFVTMTCPVPCRAPGGPVEIAEAAQIGLAYPRAALYDPAAVLVQVLSPRYVFLGNVHPETGVVCLGTRVTAAIPVKQLLLMTFATLTAQTVVLDPADYAGVFHPEAARWWWEHRNDLPLTREPFLAPRPSEVG
jgi:hypothetical protein